MNTDRLEKQLTVNPPAKEVRQLGRALRAYNQEKAGATERTSVLITSRDDGAKLIGGVYGKIAWEWLYIDLLWVDEAYRNSGLGRQLMHDIEQYARDMGIYRFHLSTADFQAAEFYKKLGYRTFGQLADMPPGHTTYFFQKNEL